MADASSASPKTVYPDWQPEYFAALLELDSEKLLERIKAAETVIHNRAEAIQQGTDGHAEQQAIQDALAALRALKKQSLRL